MIDAYTENFGPLGLFDEIHGTNKTFKSWLGELKRRDGGENDLKESGVVKKDVGVMYARRVMALKSE